jgi:hypothetical protein
MWSVIQGLALAATLVDPQPGRQESVLIRLWEDPRPIATRDLLWGAGSADRAPKPPFTFLDDSSGGTQPKVIVKDAAGTTWDVKFGPEAHAEVAASRLVWALGYFVDEMYFVREGAITGAADIGRAREFINASGGFTAARFERRDDNVRRLDRTWSFDQNPFTRSKELSGLQILMTLVANWDIEGERNNRIVEVTAPGQETHRRYLVSDLGATFGRMGGRLTSHSKWQLDDYRQERFIDAVKDDEVEFDFDGLESNMESVPLEHARWFAALASELTPSQIRQAFEAAGATPAEIDGFSAVVIARINQLRAAVEGGVLSAKTPQAR